MIIKTARLFIDGVNITDRPTVTRTRTGAWLVEQVATVRAGDRACGWYTITAGDKVLAVVVPKGRTSRVTFVPPRLSIDGIELAVPGRSEPRAPQGAKRRRAW